jgi:prepilin-type N-terminal cleavage/methylation domain-containing protein
MFDARPLPTARPNGLTLIEVVLVLSLLVIISAVSMPYLNGAFSRAHLSSASEIVRDAWTRGRLTAMQAGQQQVFRFQMKGDQFQLVPLDQLSLPEAANVRGPNADEERSASDILRLSQNRLPENVIFAAGDVATSSQVAALLGTSDDSTWSPPVLFNPDGTTSDATVVLQNDRGETIRVTLRGLTGVTSASEVGKEAVP